MAVKCDVSKEDEVKAMFAAAKAEFGGVDVCVNNAGLAHDAPLLSGSTEDWRSMLEVRNFVVVLAKIITDIVHTLSHRTQ